MTSSITPEVVGSDSTELLLDTDLTPTELARVESLETRLRMSDATVLEQKIIQGETLFRIQQERLYRSREPGERFTWEQYLQKFTPGLTENGKGYGKDPAALRQLLYLFHAGKISAMAAMAVNLPLPTGTEQLTPLLLKSPKRAVPNGGGFDLEGDWTAVLEIWKGANAKRLNPDRQLVSIARSDYERKQIHAGEDPGRMMSAARREALNKANAANPNHQPKSEPRRDYSPTPSPEPPSSTASSIPAWEIETHDDSVDAGAECKRITQAINDAHKSIGLLRGILYSQINKYGRDYMGVLRQVDAGVYSLSNIDEQVEQLGEDVEFIAALLKADVGEGELAQSTIDVDSMPSRA